MAVLCRYDYKEPDLIPEKLRGQFDCVVIGKRLVEPAHTHTHTYTHGLVRITCS